MSVDQALGPRSPRAKSRKKYDESMRDKRRMSIDSNELLNSHGQGRNRTYSQVSGYERKLSVLDDNTSNGTNNRTAQNDVREKIVNNKGVRDMHFEIAFDQRLREKALMLEDESAKKHYKV